MKINKAEKDKIADQCDGLYEEIKNVLTGKNTLACLLVMSTIYLTLCKHVKMTREHVLNKTGETWDLMELEEEENKKLSEES